MDTIEVKGNIHIFAGVPDLIGPPAPVQRVSNLVVNGGLNFLAALLAFEAGYTTGLTQCEIGTGTTAPAAGQTALVTPIGRVASSGVNRIGSAARFRFFFAAARATGHLRELGLFGHSDATGVVGTGTMFNRALINVDNTAGDRDITIVAEIAFSAG